jgi:hypothetical protein
VVRNILESPLPGNARSHNDNRRTACSGDSLSRLLDSDAGDSKQKRCGPPPMKAVVTVESNAELMITASPYERLSSRDQLLRFHFRQPDPREVCSYKHVAIQSRNSDGSRPGDESVPHGEFNARL